MEKPTLKDVEVACKELQDALMETIRLDVNTLNLDEKKRKARFRLQQARDIIRNLKLT